MDNFKKILEANQHIRLYDMKSPVLKKYGRLVEDLDFSEAIMYMEKHTVIPEVGHYYTPSLEALESMRLKVEASKLHYGYMDVQIGYCNGKNVMLDGLEYHKGTEICIAVTETVLFLGDVAEMDGNTYRSADVVAFYLAKGEAIEMHPTTMHFCPCHTTAQNPGFSTIVILPKGTNYPVENMEILPDGEGRLLWMRNEWQLVHPEYKRGIEQGNYPGLIGENYKLNTI